MSGPFGEGPLPSLKGRMLEYYVGQLAQHSDDAVIRVCPICLVGRCREWYLAHITLIGAGKLEPPHGR